MLDTARLGMACREVDHGGGVWAMLVELSVMEQRYHAVMEVASGGAGERGGPPVWGVAAGGAWLAVPL
jgi:hypothetical protein